MCNERGWNPYQHWINFLRTQRELEVVVEYQASIRCPSDEIRKEFTESQNFPSNRLEIFLRVRFREHTGQYRDNIIANPSVLPNNATNGHTKLISTLGQGVSCRFSTVLHRCSSSSRKVIQCEPGFQGPLQFYQPKQSKLDLPPTCNVTILHLRQ